MLKEKKRVLIIAYHYPPLAGAGMLKIYRTSRYLPQFGWEPLVLTVKNPEPYHRADNPIPAGVRVFRSWRIPGGNLLARVLRRFKIDERSLLLPDQHVLWIPATFIYGLYLIVRYRVDLIYVTGPPYSALIVGALLKAITHRPLVVDVRDPWSFNAARRGYPSKIHRWLDAFFEKWVLKLANSITCIYQITADGYRRLYSWTGAKIAVFYDTVDLNDLPVQVKLYSIFTLTYLGSFYPPFHSLEATLQAIQMLLEQEEIDPARFRFNYVGPPDKTFDRLVAQFKITAVVNQTGYQPLKEAQLEAAKSQMLLLLLEFATINTKLFDYLATGNTILAVVPEFKELSDLLERYADRYYRVTDNNYREIAATIKQCYHDYYCTVMSKNQVKLEQFKAELNIEKETQQLAEIFQNVAFKKAKDV